MNESSSRGAKKRLREYLLANVGRVLTQDELARVSGITAWQRRIRELRDEGLQIHSHLTREGLKPGEYLLETIELSSRPADSISRELRRAILERDGSTCQLCGAGPGDRDERGKPLRLLIDRLNEDGPLAAWNLRTICSQCITERTPPSVKRAPIELMTALRRSTVGEQRQAYEWLGKRDLDDK